MRCIRFALRSAVSRNSSGFTLIELMIVVVIIGILAAVGAVSFIRMKDRAKEGSLKSNMHTFQLATEDYNVLNNAYANRADSIATRLPGNGAGFDNPFTGFSGEDKAWENRASLNQDPASKPGITSYAGSATQYNIKGYGKSAPLTLVLGEGP